MPKTTILSGVFTKTTQKKIKNTKNTRKPQDISSPSEIGSISRKKCQEEFFTIRLYSFPLKTERKKECLKGLIYKKIFRNLHNYFI